MTRVLLVDDARLLAELEGTPVDRSSVEMKVLGPDQDFLAAAAEWCPDVIILGEGEFCPAAFETCLQLKRAPATRSIPVIYFGLGLHRDRCLDAGANLFIPRPVTRRDLRHALLEAVPLTERTAARRKVDLPVIWVGPSGATGGRCRDLSLSGAFVLLTDSPPPGQRGNLQFRAGSRRFDLEAEVVRQGPGPGGQPAGHGLRFVKIDAETGAFLSRFVRTAREQRAGKAGCEERP